MQEPKPAAGVKAVFRGLFRGVDFARRLAVNALFLLVVLFLWAWASSDDRPEVPESTVLVMAPRGVLVEQLAGDPMDRAVQKLTGSEVPEALLDDLLDAVDAARDDDRVKALYLDLDQLLGGALPKLRRLGAAIEGFQKSGKPVLAAADFYSNDRYYLAAAADRVYLHPLGAVLFEGYGLFRNYYKEGLDLYEIDWNVFRVGEFKSAAEPFLLSKMSDEIRDVNRDWLGRLWNAFLDDVAAAREVEPAAFGDSIRRFNDHLAEAGGDTARMALALGWVDELDHGDVLRQRLIEITGEDEDTHSFHGISYLDYLKAVGEDDPGDGEIAVVVARGTILPGHQPPGLIGGRSTAELIRQARHDGGVQAVVLRVDSGGGSAFASEVIRRELELVRQAGKPVVVSMGSYAASGGYWISTASDEIWAHPNTVTGSIGIFGYFPTFQNPLAKYLGVRVEGVGTTWLSGVRPDRALPDEMRTALELMIRQGYDDFLERVGEARGMSPEEVDEIGRGRVWTGDQALERGLVDHLGGLDDAIASAAERAELGDDFGVRYLEKELSFRQELMISFLTKARAFYRPAAIARRPSLADTLARPFLEEIERWSELRDPKGLYAHCLCEIE